MFLKSALRGDFDHTLRFETLKLEKPAQGSSGVCFEVRLGKEPTADRYTVVSSMNAAGLRLVQSSLVTRNEVGKQAYRNLGHIEFDSVDRLRLVRRGEVLYLFGAVPGAEEFQLVTQQTVGTKDVPVNGVRMYVHTSGSGRETIAVWKKLGVRAQEIPAGR